MDDDQMNDMTGHIEVRLEHSRTYRIKTIEMQSTSLNLMSKNLAKLMLNLNIFYLFHDYNKNKQKKN